MIKANAGNIAQCQKSSHWQEDALRFRPEAVISPCETNNQHYQLEGCEKAKCHLSAKHDLGRQKIADPFDLADHFDYPSIDIAAGSGSTFKLGCWMFASLFASQI